VGAEIFLKATKVDGVYTDDPVNNPEARIYDHISYNDVLQQGLRVMDATAISLCMHNQLPIAVFNMWKKGNLKRVVHGEQIGTTIGR
jgi:uridylate kinase